MSAGRILLLLLVAGAGLWIVRSALLPHSADSSTPDAGSRAPIERARAAARASGAQNSQLEAAAREAEVPASGGSVTENMTPDQVRALLGPPDSVDSETSETGVAREKWTYRSVGKTVVFENGIVARVE
jgi:hypothetical protein